MILLVGIEKGGTGKSTLATNLAALRAAHGHESLLIDADKQMTASYWAARRGEDGVLPRVVCVQKRGAGIHRDVQDLASKYEDIIIDAGGQDSKELRASMVVADCLCVPFQAAQPDIWTLETMEELTEQAQALNPDLKVISVINRASTHPHVPETDEAIACLKDYPVLPFSGVVIHERRAFRKAMTLGLAVPELDPSDSKATDEITTLYNTLYNARAEAHPHEPQTQRQSR